MSEGLSYTALFDGVDPRTIKDEELFTRIYPRGSRWIGTRPDVAAPHLGYQLPSGLVAPDVAARTLREWGLCAKILKISPLIAEENELQIGDIVIVPEYAGTPLYLGRETPFWIYGVDDALIRIASDPGV